MPDQIRDLVAKTPLSFVGTVQHLGAATTAAVQIGDHTAVVHVDHVLHAPEAFRNLEGQQVTVQLLDSEPLPAVGESHAFFVEGLVFGESIAVKEVGRLPVETVEPQATAALEAGATAGAFNDILADIKKDELRTHLQSADALVLGRVIGVEKVGPVTTSEHDPDWWRATLQVMHVERGDVSGDRVQFIFANSMDVRWHHTPKVKPSQGGLWVLHRTRKELADLAPYEVVDPKDFQPTQNLEVVR